MEVSNFWFLHLKFVLKNEFMFLYPLESILVLKSNFYKDTNQMAILVNV